MYDEAKEFFWGSLVAWFILGCICLTMWGCPQWRVWQQGLAGEAELERSKQNRQIKIEEAKAQLESAKYLNQAEVERAKGASEANKIIDSSLTESYLRYLYINQLEDSETEIIYIPTEAGLPILEANRFNQNKEK